jgi:hypothetical protein
MPFSPFPPSSSAQVSDLTKRLLESDQNTLQLKSGVVKMQGTSGPL